jgi:hypothetical protein
MQSYVNQPFLKKRAQYARWGSYVGIGALLIGLIITKNSIVLAYFFLLIGVLGASIGSYMANRYVREPRADQVLEKELEGLDKRYAMYHYYLSSNHVIASHYGLTVVAPRAQAGEIRFEKGRWQHKAGFRKVMQIFGEPSLGKPDQDLEQEAKWVKEWIDKALPEANIPVNGVVLFTNPKAELHLEGAPGPALSAAGLVDYMKQGLKGQPTLTTATQTELRNLLYELISTTNKK